MARRRRQPRPSRPRDVSAILRAAGDRLNSVRRAQIVRLGSAAVPALIPLLADPTGLTADPAKRTVALHALDVLAELADPHAVSCVLDVAWHVNDDVDLRVAAVQALHAMGGGALEPALALQMSSSQPEETLFIVTWITTGLGVKDRRVLELGTELLKTAPRAAAAALGTYGDPAALPALSTSLDAHHLPVTKGAGPASTIVDLGRAIGALGGTLRADQRLKILVAGELLEGRLAS